MRADLIGDRGLPEVVPHHLKFPIVSELRRLVRARRLSYATIGRFLGMKEVDVSRLFSSEFRGYSLEGLMECLAAFDRDVNFASRPQMFTRPGGRAGNRPVAVSAKASRRK